MAYGVDRYPNPPEIVLSPEEWEDIDCAEEDREERDWERGWERSGK